MITSGYGDIIREGLWTNNPGLVQLLGLCPLLAISGTVVNALGLGLATIATLLISNTLVSLLREHVRPEIRIPVYVLIIASAVTAIELVMNAWFHGLFLVLGIFIPLIVTNCAIIGRAEAFASRNSVPRAALDGLAMGVGFTGVLVAIGALREIVGQGSLLDNAHLLFGEWGRDLRIELFPQEHGFLLALLPPGAFLAMGLLIAVKNLIDAGLEARAAPSATTEPAEPAPSQS
ncbi:electron transport complex subunit E [Thioalkalivibrio sp.]|uniref:electron transport complex subunit E n=2 Tax=Thioalkalivibrio sp. TaxID=2093813 RepID=UPI0039759C77